MKNKQLSYITFFVAVFILMIHPTQALADGKYPVRIINQKMVVFPVDENTVQVVQSMMFKNSGNKKEEKLPIFLPENYADLQLSDGLSQQNMKETSKGIIDITGLDGGEEKQIVVLYKMPMFNNSSQWLIEQSYVTERVEVIIQPGVLSFSASGLLTQSDLFEMNDRQFRRFTRLDVHPNEPWRLSFRLLNISAEATQDGEQANTSEVGSEYTEDGLKVIGGEGFGYGKAVFTIVVIIVALTVTLIGLKRDLLKTTGDHRKIKRSWLVNEKEMLLEEIVQLEKDYRSSLITDSTYKKTKEKIREHLTRIKMELDQEHRG